LSLGGAHGERAEREPITGVWGRSHQRGPGAEPLVGESGGLRKLSFRASIGSGKNALFSLFCNHNKLGYLRSETKPDVPLGWGSQGAWLPEAESIFDLGIGTYNGSCKFWALGACAPLDPPLVQRQSPGRGPGELMSPEAENLAINLQQTFRDFFTINVNLSN